MGYIYIYIYTEREKRRRRGERRWTTLFRYICRKIPKVVLDNVIYMYFNIIYLYNSRKGIISNRRDRGGKLQTIARKTVFVARLLSFIVQDRLCLFFADFSVRVSSSISYPSNSNSSVLKTLVNANSNRQ